MSEYTKIVQELQEHINKFWGKELKDIFINSTVEDLIAFHSTLGLYIRNHYNLWGKQWEAMLIDGVDHSPFHPDTVSGKIIRELWESYRK